MITVQAYRAVIGAFYQKARRIQQRKTKKGHGYEKYNSTSSWNPHSSCCLDMSNFLKMFLIIFFGIILYCNLNLAFLKLLRLMCDGDIESNPGPTHAILKVVNASYHQGNIRFGATAGNQCTCNSLFALAWSVIRKVAFWNTFDLELYLGPW